MDKISVTEEEFHAEERLWDLNRQRLALINAGLSGGFEYSKVADWANEEFGLKIIMAEQRIEDLKRLKEKTRNTYVTLNGVHIESTNDV